MDNHRELPVLRARLKGNKPPAMADGRPLRSGRPVHRSLVRVHGVPAPARALLEAAPRLIERLLDDDAHVPAHASDVELPHPRFLVEVLFRPGQIRTMRDGQFLNSEPTGRSGH